MLIYNNAAADDPQKTAQIEEAINFVRDIEKNIAAAEEISNSGTPFSSYAAWERIQVLTKSFPDDPKVNKLAMKLTTNVGEFVSTLEKAKQLEQNNQLGSSLTWYLKARRTFPDSSFAQSGIDRLLDKILPAEEQNFNLGSSSTAGTPVEQPVPVSSDLDL